MKIILQIRCQLVYLMVLISNGICQYEGRYAALSKNICHFLGPSPSAISGKNPKHRNIYNGVTLRSGFFFRKTRSVTIPRFGFFPGFTDKDLKSTFRTIQQVFRYYLTSKNKITHVYAIFNSVSRLQIFYTFQRALKFHPLESPKIFLLFLVEPSLSFINIVVRTARQCQAYF